jgi:hypothetical protein
MADKIELRRGIDQTYKWFLDHGREHAFRPSARPASNDISEASLDFR